MKRHEVRARIEDSGILPSVRVNSRELARYAAETVYSAGIPVVEITMTTPGALDVIDDLAKRYPDMAVGAGTVLDEEAARHTPKKSRAEVCQLRSEGMGNCRLCEPSK